MAIPPDLMVRADTPGTARPVARISRPGSVPRHRDTAQSPLQTGKGRSSVAREEVGTTRIRGLPGGAPQGPPGDAVSIRFLAQILG